MWQSSLLIPGVLVVACLSIAYASLETWKRGGPAPLHAIPWILAGLLLAGDLVVLFASRAMPKRATTRLVLWTGVVECLCAIGIAIYQGVAAERVARAGRLARRRLGARPAWTNPSSRRRGVAMPIALPFVLAGAVALLLALWIPSSPPSSPSRLWVDAEPPAASPPRSEPVLHVDTRDVLLDGAEVMPTTELPDDGVVPRVVEALTRLRARMTASRHDALESGVIQLEVDPSIEFRHLKPLMRSAAVAGFPNVAFRAIARR